MIPTAITARFEVLREKFAIVAQALADHQERIAEWGSLPAPELVCCPHCSPRRSPHA